MLNKLRKMQQNNEAGFTLVELMIVVAIIGILAAIAIPQFAAYRIKGFNSSALSDTKNMTTSEAALFASTMGFGISVANVAIPAAPPQLFPGGAGGAGALMTGPPTAGNVNVITFTTQAGANLGQVIGLGNGVSMVCDTDALLPANPLASGNTVIAKHLNGNTFYAMDSDIELIYNDSFGVAGTALVVGNALGSTTNIDDIALAVNGPSGQPWVQM